MKLFSKKKIQIIFAGLVVALSALGATLLIGRSADSGGPAWVEKNIENYQATLAVSTNPTEQAFLQQKLGALEQIEKNRLQALRNAPTKPADPCAMRPTPEPTKIPMHIAGINKAREVPISPTDFTPTTQWQGEWAGQWMRVYAGAYADDPSLGVLWVLVENTNDYGSYDAPTRGGALTITAENELVLTLHDNDGATLYFDIASRKYLDSPGDKAATLVPLPTFTPDTGSCPADLP